VPVQCLLCARVSANRLATRRVLGREDPDRVNSVEERVISGRYRSLPDDPIPVVHDQI